MESITIRRGDFVGVGMALLKACVTTEPGFEVSLAQALLSVTLKSLPVPEDQGAKTPSSISSTMSAWMLPCFLPW